MKLDIKSILILVLLGFCLLFGYKWYFSTGNSEYKKQLKELRDSNRLLQSQRDSINIELKSLKTDFTLLKSEELSLKIDIEKLTEEIEITKANASKSKSELNKLKKDLLESRKKIEELKSNPTNRVGDELLNSLKNNSRI